jgi:hypothetical protein
MRSEANRGGQEPAARAMRALERRATTLGIRVARSVHDRWRQLPAARRAKLKGLAANVKREAVETSPPPPEVSDIEVRDLRAELTRELDRLADADISASRGSGKLAGETPGG